MAKGRNTTVLGTRIPDLMYEAIQILAESKGMTMSEYVRDVLETDQELQMLMFYRKQINAYSDNAGQG